MNTKRKRTSEEIRYAQLWAEIELPKLLKDIEQPIRKEGKKHE